MPNCCCCRPLSFDAHFWNGLRSPCRRSGGPTTGVERMTICIFAPGCLSALSDEARREGHRDVLHAEEAGEARVEELLVAREARVVLHLEDLREARPARCRPRVGTTSADVPPRSRGRRPSPSRCRSRRAACRGRAGSSVAFIVASFAFTFTALAKTASDLPFITNWSMRRSSFSVRSLPGCVMRRPSSVVVDLGVAALQVHVLERVEGEVLRDDRLHRVLAHLAGHEVRCRTSLISS